MTKKDIDNIISIICPNDEDFEKPCISPAYLKNELEALALEQEPCDAISRQAAIDCFNGKIKLYAKDTKLILEYLQGVVDAIKDLPPVTPQPKTGHWIAVENEEMKTVGYYCSECDLPMETEQWTDYCPNCGCRMVKPQESEEV